MPPSTAFRWGVDKSSQKSWRPIGLKSTKPNKKGLDQQWSAHPPARIEDTGPTEAHPFLTWLGGLFLIRIRTLIMIVSWGSNRNSGFRSRG